MKYAVIVVLCLFVLSGCGGGGNTPISNPIVSDAQLLSELNAAAPVRDTIKADVIRQIKQPITLTNPAPSQAIAGDIYFALSRRDTKNLSATTGYIIYEFIYIEQYNTDSESKIDGHIRYDYERVSNKWEVKNVIVDKNATVTGEITGEVRNIITGETLEGVSVYAIEFENGVEHTRAVQTDSKGKYLITDVLHHSYNVYASYSGFDIGSAVNAPVVIDPGSKVKDVNITLIPSDTPLVRLEGFVYFDIANDRPVEGASIIVRNSNGTATSFITATTNQSGYFSIPYVTKGSYIISSRIENNYTDTLIEISDINIQSNKVIVGPIILYNQNPVIIVPANDQPVSDGLFGTNIKLSIEATDPDNDPLFYEWQATAGNFPLSVESVVQWVPTVQCEVTCRVYDKRGGYVVRTWFIGGDPTLELEKILLSPTSTKINVTETYELSNVLITAIYTNGTIRTVNTDSVLWSKSSGDGSLSGSPFIYTAPITPTSAVLTASYTENAVVKTADFFVNVIDDNGPIPIDQKIVFATEDQIWAVNPDGSDLQQITHFNPMEYYIVDGGISVSSDGQKILFSASTTGNANDYSYANHDIFSMNADGNNIHNLTSEMAETYLVSKYNPIFTPDNQNVIFVKYLAGDTDVNSIQQITRMNLDGSNKIGLTPTQPNYNFDHLSITPRNTILARWNSFDGTTDELIELNLSGGVPQILMSLAENTYIQYPVMAKDFTIAVGYKDYYSQPSSVSGELLEIDGVGNRKVLDTGFNLVYGVTVSTDGNFIFYSRSKSSITELVRYDRSNEISTVIVSSNDVSGNIFMPVVVGSVAPQAPLLNNLEVLPVTKKLGYNDSINLNGVFTATATYTDDSQQIVTDQVIWSIAIGEGEIINNVFTAAEATELVKLVAEYTDNGITKTAEVTLDVRERLLDYITLSKTEDTTQILKNYNLSDITISAHYTNGSIETFVSISDSGIWSINSGFGSLDDTIVSGQLCYKPTKDSEIAILAVSYIYDDVSLSVNFNLTVVPLLGRVWEKIADDGGYPPRYGTAAVSTENGIYILPGPGTTTTPSSASTWKIISDGNSYSTSLIDNNYGNTNYGFVYNHISKRIYVTGGQYWAPFHNEVIYFDVVNEVWSNKIVPVGLPTIRAHSMVCDKFGHMYVIGGEVSSNVYLQNILKSENGIDWNPINTSPLPSEFVDVKNLKSIYDVVNDTIYVFNVSAGVMMKSTDFGVSWELNSINISPDEKGGNFHIYNNKMIYVGGHLHGDVVIGDLVFSRSVPVYTSVDGINWENVIDNYELDHSIVPYRRSFLSTIHDNQLYLLGGIDDLSRLYNDIWVTTLE
jgi:hypothetical protein